MPFNGAGTFTRLYSWLTDKANGVKIQADRVDAEMDGIAAGLSNVITRDGQTTIVADLPFNGKRLRNVGDPVEPTDVVNKKTHDLALPKAGGTLTGPLEISFATPYFDLVYGNVIRSRQIIDGNGTWILRDGDSGDNKIYVTAAGAVWTKQFGDLNTRIETRAAAFAEAARVSAAADAAAAAASAAAANTNANARVAKSGDTMAGDLSIQKAYPATHLSYPGVIRAAWMVDSDASVMWRNSDTGTVYARIRSNGAIETSQFGDLNARIEARADAYASAYAGYRVAKTGDTMTGDLTISKTYPTLVMLWNGVYRSGWQVRENARTYLMELDTGAALMSVGPSGDITTRQLGDLATHIENRAAAFAEDRIANGYGGVLRDIGSNFGVPGYFRLSNNLILQWGYGAASDVYVPFPVTFPNALLHVGGTGSLGTDGLAAGAAVTLSTDNHGAAGFNLRVRAIANGGLVGQGSGNLKYFWFAIGY